MYMFYIKKIILSFCDKYTINECIFISDIHNSTIKLSIFAPYNRFIYFKIK